MMNSKVVKGLLIGGAVIVGGTIVYKVVKAKKAKNKEEVEKVDSEIVEEAQAMSAEAEVKEAENVTEVEKEKTPEEILKEEVDQEVIKSQKEGYTVKIEPMQRAMIDAVSDLLGRKGIDCDPNNEVIKVQIATLYNVLRRDNENCTENDILSKIEKTMKDWLLQDQESKHGANATDVKSESEEKIDEIDEEKAAEAKAKMDKILEDQEKKAEKKGKK